MTTDEYVKKLLGKVAEIQKGKPLNIAAQDTHVKMSERIFEKGLLPDGGTVPYNSTDPIYVSPATSPKNFPTKGKNGDAKFKNGKPHMTGFFKSYKAYREEIGRPTEQVNLFLWGNLQSDFSKGVKKINDESYASTVSWVANIGKLKKFSDYFELNKDERENFRLVLEDETLKILR